MSVRKRLPIATLVLLTANLFAAFVVLIDPQVALAYGFSPVRPRLDHLFISLFLHGNVLHLMGNMVFLAAVGAAVEISTGTGRFLSVYFAGGLLGALVHLSLAPLAGNTAPLIGASGAIAACAAYYGFRYLGMRVPIWPRVSVSVLSVISVWLVLQLAGAVVRIGDDPGGTAFWAHLGGIAAGLLLAILYRSPDFGDLRLGHEVLDQMNRRSAGAAIAAAKLHLDRHPNDPKGLRALMEAYRAQGDVEDEAKTMVSLLGKVSDVEAAELLSRLVSLKHADLLPSLQRVRWADRVAEADAGCARELLRSVVAGTADDPQRPEAILAWIALDRDRDPGGVRELAQDLATRYPMHPSTEVARKRGWIQ